MTEILHHPRGRRGRLVLLAILFKALWKVPNADEALIVTGFGVKARARPARGRRARARRPADGAGRGAEQDVQDRHGRRQVRDPGAPEGPVPVAARRRRRARGHRRRQAEDPRRREGRRDLQGRRRRPVDHQRGHALPRRGRRRGEPDAPPGQGGLPRPPALDHRRAVGRGPDRQPQRARPGDARRLRAGDAEARARRRLAPDPGHHRSLGLHRRARRAAHGRGQDAGPHRPGRRRPRGDRARAGGRGAEGRRPARHRAQARRLPGRARARDGA